MGPNDHQHVNAGGSCQHDGRLSRHSVYAYADSDVARSRLDAEPRRRVSDLAPRRRGDVPSAAAHESAAVHERISHTSSRTDQIGLFTKTSHVGDMSPRCSPPVLRALSSQLLRAQGLITGWVGSWEDGLARRIAAGIAACRGVLCFRYVGSGGPLHELEDIWIEAI